MQKILKNTAKSPELLGTSIINRIICIIFFSLRLTIIKLVGFFKKRAAQMLEEKKLPEEYNELIATADKLVEQINLHAKTREQILTEREQLNNLVILTEDDWKVFKDLFTEVWPDFFHQLHLKYPYMSQAEIRLLALWKLKLSSREMANMIGISLDSLRKSRYRLRKKYPGLLLDGEQGEHG